MLAPSRKAFSGRPRMLPTFRAPRPLGRHDLAGDGELKPAAFEGARANNAVARLTPAR